MKKTIVIAAVVLSLASVAAYAQMHHRGDGRGPQGHGPMMHGHSMPHDMMAQGMMGQGMMGMQHGGGMHGAATRPRGDNGPASLAFHAINLKMHEGMDIAFTGNADVDFVKGMIPHHQGAIDMAKTVIAFGKDPMVKKLAEDVIKAQEGEIALMQDWLKKNAQ